MQEIFAPFSALNEVLQLCVTQHRGPKGDAQHFGLFCRQSGVILLPACINKSLVWCMQQASKVIEMLAYTSEPTRRTEFAS